MMFLTALTVNTATSETALNLLHLHAREFGTCLALSDCERAVMLRISTVEARNERRLVLEGKLISPWTVELRKACEKSRQDLKGRELIVDLKNLTVISEEGENLLAALMNDGVRFHCSGVFTRQVLRQVARGRAHKPQGETQ